jgi:hypothetical protein
MKNAIPLCLALLLTTPALAQERQESPLGPSAFDEGRRPEVRQTETSPFEKWVAIGVYATGHAGSYLAGGIGGRLRFEPFEFLGVEAYLEGTIVDWPGGFRHDYPNGFNIYVPIRAGDFRFRPFLGFCDILSFIEPEQEHAPRADDILFGAHAGVGVELGIHAFFSLFADLQANFYAGHDRTSEGWTGGVDEELGLFWNIQLNIGVQGHALNR